MQCLINLVTLVGLVSIGCAWTVPQDTKAVKGGHFGQGGYQFNNATANLVRRFYNNETYHGGHNMSVPLDFERGVCYIEVPTASLVNDPTRVPAGNGSRPDLSRVRTCCHGYVRNIHNFKRCDPVCTQECINALCTAPDVCSCFPDHVRNLAGICMPTCPIGCQNGHCNGQQCQCSEGYRLNHDGKFCVPVCKNNCGGIGNCTEPNVCQCKEGYSTTVDGSCQPSCQRCDNGDCIGPNNCQCKQGFQRNEYGECVPFCPRGCGANGQCIAPNTCSCPHGLERDDVTNECVIKCSQPCVNGVCTPGNRCMCNQGFVLDRADPTGTRCIPLCPGGCPNGVCSGPNFCICNVGFIKDRSIKGSQTCVKRLRRSIEVEDEKISEPLVFEISDYEDK